MFNGYFDTHYGYDVMCHLMSNDEVRDFVRALRTRLDEDTATFAARWRRSARTAEDWEQGRRQPDAFVLDDMRNLAARTKKKAAKAK